MANLFKKATVASNSVETQANKILNSSKFLAEGTHDVKVVEVETFEEPSPALGVTFEAENGAQHKERLWIYQNVWENGVKTDKEAYGWGLVKFLLAVGYRPSELDSFFEACANPTFLNVLIGSSLSITISRGKKGVNVRTNAANELEIYDISESQELAPEIARIVGTQTFKDWPEVNQFLKDNRAVLPRAFLRVESYSHVEGHEDANSKALQALDTAAAPASGSVPPSFVVNS